MATILELAQLCNESPGWVRGGCWMYVALLRWSFPVSEWQLGGLR